MPKYETYFLTELFTKVKPNINSVEGFMLAPKQTPSNIVALAKP
jgi:hypothetical protein